MRIIDRKEVEQILMDSYTQPVYEMSQSSGGLTTSFLYRHLTLEQIEILQTKLKAPVSLNGGNAFTNPQDMLRRIYGGESLISHQLAKVDRFVEDQYQEKQAFIHNFPLRVETFYNRYKLQILNALPAHTATAFAKINPQNPSQDPVKDYVVKLFTQRLEQFKKSPLEKFDFFFNGDDVRPFSAFIAQNLPANISSSQTSQKTS